MRGLVRRQLDILYDRFGVHGVVDCQFLQGSVGGPVANGAQRLGFR